MKSKKVKRLLAAKDAVLQGEIAPGRVWIVNKRADGTVERAQMDPEEYRRGQAAAAAKPESAALPTPNPKAAPTAAS